MTIRVLPASYGDCLLLSWVHEDRKCNMLVDGGPPVTYPVHLKPMLENMRQHGEMIDLLVVTHYDRDHIGGILQWHRDARADLSVIKETWFNSGGLIARQIGQVEAKDRNTHIIPDNEKKMSQKDANTLERILQNPNTKLIKKPGTANRFGAEISILSPGQQELEDIHATWTIEDGPSPKMSGKTCDHAEPFEELLQKKFVSDDALPNGSSIATLVTANNKTILLLADAIPLVIEDALRTMGYNENKRLQVDAVKVAHHGSKFNNSPGLYAIISSSKFIISTDGTRDKMPHKEALARIIAANPGCTLYFNYEKPASIFTEEEKQQYHFRTECLVANDYLLEL